MKTFDLEHAVSIWEVGDESVPTSLLAGVFMKQKDLPRVGDKIENYKGYKVVRVDGFNVYISKY